MMSPSAAHDAWLQGQYFFQGWTSEHTAWLIILVVLLAVWWFKPGKGA